MNNVRVSELRKVLASALREEDLMVVALAQDERGGGSETVAVPLGELRKYLQMSPLHVQSIPEGLARKPVDVTPEQRAKENASADSFLRRMKKLAGVGQPECVQGVAQLDEHGHWVTSPSSGMNAELLKEAIADAKAVRETALKNAKQALDDAFVNKLETKIRLNAARWDEALDKPIGEK